MKTSTLTRLGAFVLGATLLLSACNTSTGPSDPSQPGDTTATITVAGQYPVMSLDPHGTDGAAAATLLTSRAIFSRLTMPTADGKLEGNLAESWKASPDGKTWTFKLKAGAKFADDKPITAEDFAASLKRMRDGKSPLAGSFADVQISGQGDQVVVTAPAQTRRCRPSSACSTSCRKIPRPRSGTAPT